MQNNPAYFQCTFDDKTAVDLESPTSLYGRQIVKNNQSSNINFGFHLTRVPNLPCPCCRRRMYTTEEIKKLASELSIAKGSKIAEVLSPHVQNLHPVEQQIATMLVGLSNKYPYKNIKELLLFKRSESKNLLEHKQKRIIEEVIRDAKSLKDSHIRGEALQKLRETYQLISQPTKKIFKRKNVINTIKYLKTQTQHDYDAKILETMWNKIIVLPASFNNFNAFIVKYSQQYRSNLEIATRLFSPNQSTIEHIKPALRNSNPAIRGSNQIHNCLAMCSSCNGKRRTIPYYSFVKENHQMTKNLRHYMEAVQAYIKRVQPRDYTDYIKKVADTLRKESTSPKGGEPLLNYQFK